jgi:hypothetical protein
MMPFWAARSNMLIAFLTAPAAASASALAIVCSAVRTSVRLAERKRRFRMRRRSFVLARFSADLELAKARLSLENE